MKQRAQHAFDNAIYYLKQIRDIVNEDEFKELVSVLSRKKRVWSSGMGKAGQIAHKFSATLSSNSIPAAFIHAGEALHGDFGAINKDDILVVFSNSGKTDEIIKIVEKARNIDAYVVLITGSSDSKLADLTSLCLSFGKVEEACILGLTPTTSITIMTTLADAIVIGVQEKIGISFSEYSKNHHAGYLGEISRKFSEMEDKSG